MALKLTQKMLDAGNAKYEAQASAELAAFIRAFDQAQLQI